MACDAGDESALANITIEHLVESGLCIRANFFVSDQFLDVLWNVQVNLFDSEVKTDTLEDSKREAWPEGFSILTTIVLRSQVHSMRRRSADSPGDGLEGTANIDYQSPGDGMNR